MPFKPEMLTTSPTCAVVVPVMTKSWFFSERLRKLSEISSSVIVGAVVLICSSPVLMSTLVELPATTVTPTLKVPAPWVNGRLSVPEVGVAVSVFSDQVLLDVLYVRPDGRLLIAPL